MGVRLSTVLLGAWLSLGSAPAQAQDHVGHDDPAVDRELTELSSELVRARFSRTGPAVEALLARDDLSARQRNDALEILAVTQVALGQPEAEVTLRRLYGRDPKHRLSNPDLGPEIQAAFSRAREQATPSVRAALGQARIEGDPDGGSPAVIVPITSGVDAVHEVELAYREGTSGAYARLALAVQGDEARARLPVLGGGELVYYVEAHAPSGAVLARIGSADAPLSAALPPTPRRVATFVLEGDGAPSEPPEGGSVFGEWWFWSAAALVIGGAVAGWFLLGPPSQGPEAGSLGQGALE